jgi:transcription antitermination factor NusG
VPSRRRRPGDDASARHSTSVEAKGRELDPRWYAVWTRSRHEKHVRDRLAEKRVDVFLPTIARWSRWKDRKKKIDWPLFPGYCFVRFDVSDRMAVLTCDGVVQIVGTEGMPTAIPDAEVDGIRQLVESALSYDPCPFIKEGDEVRVVSGPLRGLTGRLVRKGSHARLVLAVNLMGDGLRDRLDPRRRTADTRLREEVPPVAAV